MPSPVDISGQFFGRWRVIGPAPGRNKHRSRLWRVRCQCGHCAERTTAELCSGKSQSCGCLRAELLAQRNRHAPRNSTGKRIARPKPSRRCNHCQKSYQPLRSSSKYCSEKCRGRAQWTRIAADPQRKKDHARRVTAAYKRDTYVEHESCAECGKPFCGPPQRLYCSRDCLEAVIRSGTYRRAFLRRRAEAELAALKAEMEERS